nr:immunoglobulin heavy chain junction region [Mus musculus]
CARMGYGYFDVW